jgi:sialate O-acetylesterase
MKIEGRAIRIYFTHALAGLVVKGERLQEFTIAGKDKRFTRADARIEENTVLVWNDKIKSPCAVRYAWADNPSRANLYNKAGLPASLFRTDTWPVLTALKAGEGIE